MASLMKRTLPSTSRKCAPASCLLLKPQLWVWSSQALQIQQLELSFAERRRPGKLMLKCNPH